MLLDPGQAPCACEPSYVDKQKKKGLKGQEISTTHARIPTLIGWQTGNFLYVFKIPILIGKGIKQTHLHEETSRWASRQDMTYPALSVVVGFISVCVCWYAPGISAREPIPAGLFSRQPKHPHQSGWKINDTTVQDVRSQNKYTGTKERPVCSWTLVELRVWNSLQYMHSLAVITRAVVK